MSALVGRRPSLLLAATLALAAVGCDASPPTSETPSPDATRVERTLDPSPVATETPEATGSPAGAALAVLERIEEEVSDLRGLEPPDIPPVDIIDRAQLADELERVFDAEYPVEEREEDNIALRALGLITADQDYAELQKRLLGEQVLGFYDSVEKRMVVVTDAGLDAEARLTYAHEFTHALQDAAFDLTALEEPTLEEDDASLALSALIEGDATLAMLSWAVNGGLGLEELMSLGEEITAPDTSGVPEWMVELITFPYLDGQTFVAALAGDPESPQAAILDPDFGAIDEAFEDPPESTEQVIHFEKWEAREAPVELDAVSLGGPLGETLGGSWTDVTPTTMGEALIRITLAHYGVPAGEAREAAAGWGGDELAVASGPDGAFALAWRLAWDTGGDAEQFASAYGGIAADLPFEAELVEQSDVEHVVLHASSPDVMAELRRAAGG